MICAVVMLAPACTKDLTEGPNLGSMKMEKVTYSVSFEQPEAVSEDGTRIGLNGDNQIVWEDGDEVRIAYSYPGINDDGETETMFADAVATVDGGYAGVLIDEEIPLDFELPSDVEYTVLYACSTKCAVDEYTTTRIRPRFSVPGGSTAESGNTCAASYDFGTVLRDVVAVGPVDEVNKTVILRNSAAFLEVQLTGGGEELWSVDVLSKSQNLRSKYAYVYNPTSENPYLNVYQSIEPTKEDPSAMGGAHFNAGGEILSDTPLKIYFAMPVEDFPAGDLFIQVRTNNYTRLYRSGAAHSFTRNHVKVLKAINVTPLDTNSVTYEPLDVDGVSNCYKVTPSEQDQYFSMPVTNVNGDFELNDGSTDNFGIWPMWATQDGLVEDISVVYSGSKGIDSRVYFKVPGGKGNGSMMLTGGPINSTLIGTNWAWHIWITDAEEQTIGSEDLVLTFLDRGPGALWTPKSAAEVEAMTAETAAQTVGFMYQYGRHIPFPGPKSLQNLDGNDAWGYETCSSDGSGTKGRFKSNTPAVEHYHFARWQNAFTAYGHTTKTIDGTKYYNMQFLQYNGTWATDMTQDKVSTLTGTEDTWLTTEKGKQDPCPQGYRVATFKELIRIFRLPASDDVTTNTDNYCALNSYSTGFAGGTKQWRWTGSTKVSAFVDAFGGYVHHRENATAKAALNNEFIWLPYGGMRLQYRNNANHNNVGSLYYAGMWDNNNDGTTIKSGYAFLWGTCDHYRSALDSATKIYLPSTTISDNFDTALTRLPCVFAYGSDNVWNVSAISSPMPASDAMPVRCVKLPTVSGEATVSSLAGSQSDANAWN